MYLGVEGIYCLKNFRSQDSVFSVYLPKRYLVVIVVLSDQCSVFNVQCSVYIHIVLFSVQLREPIQNARLIKRQRKIYIQGRHIVNILLPPYQRTTPCPTPTSTIYVQPSMSNSFIQ